MPTINVIPSWNIKKLTEDQAMSGTIYANGVYKFLYTRNNEQLTQVMSLKDVIPVIKDGTEEITDYQLVPSVLFFNDGFSAGDDLGDDDTLLLSEIDEVEREYIKYSALTREQRRKSRDEDPFEFNFINAKTGKPFKIVVDHNHFVGIPAITKKGDVHTNFGYINHIETNPETGMVTSIVMDSITSTRGVFRGSTTIIPYNNLRGIYHYGIIIEKHKTKTVTSATDDENKDTEVIVDKTAE